MNLTSEHGPVGLHLLPNSLSMSLGSLFAGWVMHATGRYKFINLTFGIFPFIGAVSMYRLKVDSNFWVQWFSIVCTLWFNLRRHLALPAVNALTDCWPTVGPTRVWKCSGLANYVECASLSSVSFIHVILTGVWFASRIVGPPTGFVISLFATSHPVLTPVV